MDNLQQINPYEERLPIMPEQMAAARPPGGPGTITGHMRAQEIAGLAPPSPGGMPGSQMMAPGMNPMQSQQLNEMMRMMYLQSMINKLMGIAKRDPRALRVLMEDEMGMNKHQIQGMYKLMLQQLETSRPTARPSIAGLMEKRHGKAKNFMSEYYTPPTPARISEPGDITAGWAAAPTAFGKLSR